MGSNWQVRVQCLYPRFVFCPLHFTLSFFTRRTGHLFGLAEVAKFNLFEALVILSHSGRRVLPVRRSVWTQKHTHTLIRHLISWLHVQIRSASTLRQQVCHTGKAFKLFLLYLLKSSAHVYLWLEPLRCHMTVFDHLSSWLIMSYFSSIGDWDRQKCVRFLIQHKSPFALTGQGCSEISWMTRAPLWITTMSQNSL